MAYAGKTVDSFSLRNPRTRRLELYRLVYVRCRNRRCSRPWHGPYLYRRVGKREFYVGLIESDATQHVMRALLDSAAALERRTP